MNAPHTIDADIAVVGAGPAGLAAALAAAECGRRVVVIDENHEVGGQIWRGAQGPAVDLRDRAAAAGVEFRTGLSVATAAQSSVGFRLLATDATEALVIQAARVIIATGARELLLPFPGWTLPGVFGAGGLQALAKGGLDVRGWRIVVAGSGPLLLAVAQQLASRGARVQVVAEQAPAAALRQFAAALVRHPSKLWQAARLRLALGFRYRSGTWPVRAEGDDRVRSVVLTDGMRERSVACDALAAGFGLVPNTQLAAILGCRIEQGTIVTDDLLETSVPGVYAAGEPLGIGGVDCALLEGRLAGLAAGGDDARARALQSDRHKARRFAVTLARTFALRPELLTLGQPDTLVCRCEDVPRAAIDGCESWRDAKLRTRCGMGACQARVCGPAVSFLTGWPVGDAQPPISPVPISALAGFAAGAPDANR